MQIPGQQDPNQIGLNVGPNTDDVYDKYQIPPNLKVCKIHRKATLVKTQIPDSFLQDPQKYRITYCPCCNLPKRSKRLPTTDVSAVIPPINVPLCAKKDELAHLGVSFPLYFQFIQYSILWLLILFLICGAFDITTNVIGAFCDSSDSSSTSICQRNYITILTLANKQDKALYLKIHQWLNLGGMIAIIILFQFYRTASIKLLDDCEKSQETPADYTVEVQDLPKDASEDEIKKFFTDLDPNLIIVEKVNMTYSISKLVKLQREYDKLRKTQEINKRKKLDDANLDTQVQTLDTQITEIKQSLQNPDNRSFTGIAFVTLSTPEQSYIVLEKLRAGFLTRLWYRLLNCICCCKCVYIPRFRDNYILDVRRAPEPSDINWEYLDSTDCKKGMRRSLTFLITLIMLAASFGLILWVYEYKNKHKDEEWLSILSSIIVVVINLILGTTMRKLVNFERHSTFTRYNTGVAEKLSIATFVNTAVVTLLANVLSNAVGVTNFITSGDSTDFWGSTLMSSITTLLLINAFSTNLTNLLNPAHIMSYFKRRKIAKQGDSCTLTQDEANKAFEGPQIDLAQRYANAMKTLLASFFFAPAVPIVLVFSFFGQILTYYNDFYLLVRRHARPRQLGGELARALADDLEWAPIAFAVGNIIFNRQAYLGGDIYDEWLRWLDIIAIIIAVAVLVLPMEIIHKKFISWLCCSKEENPFAENPKNYNEYRQYFIDDYDVVNPVTQKEAKILFKARMKGSAPIQNKYLVNNNGPNQPGVQIQMQGSSPSQVPTANPYQQINDSPYLQVNNSPYQQGNMQPSQQPGYYQEQQQIYPQFNQNPIQLDPQFNQNPIQLDPQFNQNAFQPDPQQQQINLQMQQQINLQQGYPQMQTGMQQQFQGSYQGMPNPFQQQNPNFQQGFADPNGYQDGSRLVYYGQNAGNPRQGYFQN